MRWVKRIALTLVAIVVLLLGIGLILPSTFKVQRSVDIAAAPGEDLPADRRPTRMEKMVGMERTGSGHEDRLQRAALGPWRKMDVAKRI